jgi:hypothetical protein
MKKVAIVGSRDFTDYAILKQFILDHIDVNEIDMIVSGGAKGADSLAEVFADEFQKKKAIFKPDWTRYGKVAGFLRNTDIIDSSDICFAFLSHPNSNGTLDSISKAKERKIPLFVYEGWH